MMTTARNILRSFYSILKDNDAYLKFVFITGVSKFSKLNLFSGLNNLTDITIDENYATITGYTQNDLETHFAEYLEGKLNPKLNNKVMAKPIEITDSNYRELV